MKSHYLLKIVAHVETVTPKFCVAELSQRTRDSTRDEDSASQGTAAREQLYRGSGVLFSEPHT